MLWGCSMPTCMDSLESPTWGHSTAPSLPCVIHPLDYPTTPLLLVVGYFVWRYHCICSQVSWVGFFRDASHPPTFFSVYGCPQKTPFPIKLWPCQLLPFKSPTLPFIFRLPGDRRNQFIYSLNSRRYMPSSPSGFPGMSLLDLRQLLPLFWSLVPKQDGVVFPFG